jgi:hypothetical protein
MSWCSVFESSESQNPQQTFLNISAPKPIFDARNEEFEQDWKNPADMMRCNRAKGAIPQIKVQQELSWDQSGQQRRRNQFDQATDQHIRPAAPHLGTKMQESISSTTIKNAYADKFPDSMCVRVHDWETDRIHRADGLGVHRETRPMLMEQENLRRETCNDRIMVQDVEDDHEITTVDCGVTNQNNASFI